MVGKKLAVLGGGTMTEIHRLRQSFWEKRPHRWLMAILFGAAFGVAAGHTVIASLSGSVSVVEGRSMAPTFGPGARVYTAPISTPLERGDIVLVDDGHKDYALKRIVGLPGETVCLWRGYVFINRQMLHEPYLPKYTYTFPDQRNETFVFKLGEEQYFVLGDNRLFSADSRAYGPVERKRIKSRVPLPKSDLRPDFDRYKLPNPGKRSIQPM